MKLATVFDFDSLSLYAAAVPTPEGAISEGPSGPEPSTATLASVMNTLARTISITSLLVSRVIAYKLRK